MKVINISAGELCLSAEELALRMQVPRGFDMASAEKAKDQLLPVIDCKAVSVRVPVTNTEKGIALGEIFTESKNLRSALEGSKEALIFAVTLGMGVDRHLLRLSKTSVSELFLADAVASAYAEAAADRAQELLLGGNSTKKRFSPGYGDLPLELQPAILSALSAEKHLGLTLTDTLLMKPQKSITAIVGMENE